MKLYGLIGYPVKHSLSSAMHNAAFKELGLDAEYRLFEVEPDELEGFLLDPDAKFKDTKGNSVRAGDVAGFNITIPHKVKAREILEGNFPSDREEKDAYYVKLSGAVNTVRRDNGKPSYWNTDASGFRESIKEEWQFEVRGKSVLVLGCGGAGRSVIASLSWKDLYSRKIYAYEINQETVRSVKKHSLTLSEEWQKIFEEKVQFISTDEQLTGVIKDCQLLVNATPIGMKEGDPSVIDKDLLHKDLYVYDVVYNRKTQLVRDGEARCRAACNGRGMLLHQGAHAFNFWTGKEAPVDVMRQMLENSLNKG